jgi:hypothetical protein
MDNRHTKPGWLMAVSLLLLLWLGQSGNLVAAELISLDVDHEAGTYTVRLAMELDVSAEHVQQVLTNYRELNRMNPAIKESRILPSPGDGIVRVFTRMESCVLFFCVGFTRVEDVSRSASGDLIAVIVPEQSDFETGTALWQITERGERTLLVYQASMQPGFFIPPMIGSYIVKEKLRNELLTSINRIECCASAQLRLSKRAPKTGSTHIQRSGTC